MLYVHIIRRLSFSAFTCFSLQFTYFQRKMNKSDGPVESNLMRNATRMTIQPDGSPSGYTSPYDEDFWAALRGMGISLVALDQALTLFSKKQMYEGQQRNFMYAAQACRYRATGEEIKERRLKKQRLEIEANTVKTAQLAPGLEMKQQPPSAELERVLLKH